MNTKLGISKRLCAAVIGRAGLFIGDTPAVGQTENEIEVLWGEAVRGDWKDGTRYLAWERRSFVLIAAMDGETSICLHFVRPSGRLYPQEIGFVSLEAALNRVSAGGQIERSGHGSWNCR